MPRPRILPYVILGILSQKGKTTAYEILDEFNNEIGEFWKASHSQLYPELNKMITDQWIEKSEGNARESSYTLTNTGQEALHNWLLEPINEGNDALTSLKIYFIADEGSDILQYLLQSTLELHDSKLAHLLARKAQLFPNQAAIHSQYGHYLILDRAIEREENHILWLKRHQ
ncbi:transcriptional regulator [Weissella oryzae SG25]|uniref:Transcriptional regulator n=1 Tax=Weissella oryzae (strain DSM 25784 / JCM 18191 / LMG 30913 / SG25) TaxID=1329250 RepID=A0A069CTL0_WEIOS|nr:PadR family transcriptional regulator [Weissella oryzae]GAK31155.1 transcriptional regulator [Weissella oryzae SG25]